jgi:integrating conjugative element relaxase (TIGR03760 family)
MLTRWFKSGKKGISEERQALSPPSIPGVMPVKSSDQLLNQHTGRITQINELAGLSSANFECFYLSAIKNYARFVQLLPASEVHHHAGPGGMLTHALEVCVMALKVRRSYLLSDAGGAEEISKKQHLWTYAVFIAALCHDLAKVAVDQEIAVYDESHRELTWNPWDKYIDEQGKWYTSEFVRDRQYRLHEKASPLLIHRIISSQGMKWIGSDLSILSKWVACLSGDMDNASSIGEIVSIADGKSVASNLGADSSRMSTVKTKPLHEKMLTALRHLLMEGELPLNRNGAAGWVVGDDCWLVSKRTVDAIRDQLTQEGHSGIPSKNGRLFDILQEHGVIIPFGEKAIWPSIIEGEGWSNNLTLIKVDAKKIWTNPAQRPSDFDGRIILEDGKEKQSAGNSSDQINKPEKAGQEASPRQDENELILPSTAHQSDIAKEKEVALKKVPYKTLEPLEQAISNFIEEDDLLAFLPSLAHEEESSDSEKVIDLPDKQKETEPQIKTTASVIEEQSNEPDKPPTPLTVISGPTNNKVNDHQDQVSQFLNWLQDGIQSGRLKTNQAKARIHRVDEGAILITPGIFQDFSKAELSENVKWTAVQQKVLKKNWHVRDGKGLNVVKYQVKGQSKQTTVNAILFKDASKIFGEHPLPESNPHLIKIG